MDLKYLLNAVKCPNCERGFQRSCDLKRHIKTTHGEPIECLLCHKVLKSGIRRDVRVRHLIHGCIKFSESFNDNPDFLKIAKQYADEFFDEVENVRMRERESREKGPILRIDLKKETQKMENTAYLQQM